MSDPKYIRQSRAALWKNLESINPGAVPRRPRQPICRHPRRVTNEDMLRHEIERNPLIIPYNWPLPHRVPALLAQRGNPYLDFWQQVDGGTGNIWNRLTDGRIPPAFEDTEKLKAALGPTWYSPAILERDPGFLASIARHLCRGYGTHFYSWAIPNPEAIRALVELDQPIIELGSGRGYWARQLEIAGARIVTEELRSDTYQWFWRAPDRTTQRSLPSDHALMFCWPTYGYRWSYHRLRRFTGRTVVYIGERDGCTAERYFHQELENRWEKTAEVYIPQWDGLHDTLMVFKR